MSDAQEIALRERVEAATRDLALKQKYASDAVLARNVARRLYDLALEALVEYRDQSRTE
jgi:hypothetical protein